MYRVSLIMAATDPPLQVANGRTTDTLPMPVDLSLAAAVKAAWLPVQSGQAIPMLGERGFLP